eukprot:jgi/Astpho2/2215/Aster-x0098
MLSSSRLSPTLLLQIPDDDSLHGFGTDQPNGFGADQPNGLSTSVEEVQLSEEELQKARDDFKAQMEETMKGKSDMFDSMVEDEGKIRLGEDGWKLRYYQEKLGVPPTEQQEIVQDMVKSYVEGLCWVMSYYYDGVASWTWFYPYHYAPFASDLVRLPELDIKFEIGEPFKPFNQLMGVLPAASAHALPKPYQASCHQALFTEWDSPILDFYPKHFAVDINGKRFAWQGVALLPFIDETRLLDATGPLEEQLSEEETHRNGRRLDLFYVSSAHPLTPDIFEMADELASLSPAERARKTVPMNPELTQGSEGRRDGGWL